MTTSVPRLATLLRASLLTLMILGMLIKPMLGSFCEIHALGDALAFASRGQQHDTSKAEHKIDQDHASGAHDQVHEVDNSAAYADIVSVIILPSIRFESLRIPLPTASQVLHRHISAPFRPPIA